MTALVGYFLPFYKYDTGTSWDFLRFMDDEERNQRKPRDHSLRFNLAYPYRCIQVPLYSTHIAPSYNKQILVAGKKYHTR